MQDNYQANKIILLACPPQFVRDTARTEATVAANQYSLLRLDSRYEVTTQAK